ncbi:MULTISPECIES: DMT family transporter [Rhodococcus]|uniref:DMT family transporter n=1 Tax=Rhodococcus oxybenzonivorans TaxID=1990687 RepID=A0AAE5A7Y9_9NOCA|nr:MULTISPECIES: DMT family transporter [Rhodococcus]MDV7242439.1 DMT family transporter [Rhodococcus oxybenzonivorans]MDV7266693.1 DMT family transporter [Rhodococcus oxybenzonivorans]MDV7277186.1 DMT family transporter [Rhodococcus oxybenzonivorans]MDV7331928.1 DMT family transporter [Rhodococcus oxybenzonivorans]MDV7344149.1 DMT family transporter [Rhodococcus oxybenzonivorans]
MSLPLASVLCALVAALLFACASVAQQSAASAVPEDAGLMTSLVRSPRWWAGVAGDGGGYIMQAVALALGSVLVVQPLLVTALLFALPLSAKFSGYRLNRTTWVLAVALAAALAVFLVVGNPTEGNIDAPFREWVIPLAIVVSVAAAAALAGMTKIDPGWRALLLGAASGILYGVAVAFTKYVVELVPRGLWTVLSSWQTWSLVAAGLVGVYLQQRAFQVGPLSASLPALTIAEPLAAVFLGMTVLDERLRVDGPGLIVVGCAVAVMLIATIGLSRSQAQRTAGTAATSPVSS